MLYSIYQILSYCILLHYNYTIDQNTQTSQHPELSRITPVLKSLHWFKINERIRLNRPINRFCQRRVEASTASIAC